MSGTAKRLLAVVVERRTTPGTFAGSSPGMLADCTNVVCSPMYQATDGTWKAPV